MTPKATNGFEMIALNAALSSMAVVLAKECFEDQQKKEQTTELAKQQQEDGDLETGKPSSML